MTAAGHLRAALRLLLLGACLAAMVAASGASAQDAVLPSAPGPEPAGVAAIGSGAVKSKPIPSVTPMPQSMRSANAGARSRLLRTLEGGAAGQPRPAESPEELWTSLASTLNSGVPIPATPASVIEGCPRDVLTRLLAGAAAKADALSALAIEHETLKLCHERQLIVTRIFEAEAQLRALRTPAETAPAAINRSPAVASAVPAVVPQLSTAPTATPAPITTAPKPAKTAPEQPRYGWFSIVGMAGDLRAGVTDGRRVWFVREGDPLPGAVGVGRISAQPPGVRLKGGDDSALSYRARPGDDS